MTTTTANSTNYPKQSDSVREAHAIVREAHAKTGPLSVRFFGFIRKSLAGIGNAKASWKDNSMQNFHRAPLSLIVVMAAALISLLSPILRGQLAVSVSAESDSIPESGTWYSMQLTNSAPWPFNPFPDLPYYKLENGSYVFDDRFVDYDQIEKQAALKAEAEGTSDGKDGANGPMEANFGPTDLWIELTGITNDLASLTLHNTDTNLSQQLLSKMALTDPYWIPGEITTSLTNEIIFTPVPTAGQPIQFFRGAQGYPVVYIYADSSFSQAIEPNSATADPGQIGVFQVALGDVLSSNLTVFYRTSGTAINGVDYTNVTGTVTILAGTTLTNIVIQPIEDSLVEFEEPVTLALVVTNGYLVDPSNPSATITINDNFSTNLFTDVAYLSQPIGIDYHPPTHSLLVSFNYNTGETNNFALINTNGIVTNWSRVHGLTEEIKVATVKTTANGFTNGDTYFGTGTNGVIGRLSANGTVSNLNWAVLTTNTSTFETLIRGGLYVDDSGSFGGDLIAVTGNLPSEGGGVWRITSSGVATRLADITNSMTPHLEGVVTLTNNVEEWGPWAGKIITGAETDDPPLVHAIDPDGTVTSFALGIAPEDFDIIPPNQNLYCVDYTVERVVKLSSTLLTNYWGDLLITQGGETGSAKLSIVHWDSTNSVFVIRSIAYPYQLEHVTFAPINIPDL